RRIDAAEVSVDVPATPEAIAAATKAFDAIAPVHKEGTLSFWEMYAQRALEERLAPLGIEGAEAPPPSGGKAAAGQVAIRVRQAAAGGPLSAAGLKAGDLLLDVGGEPFFGGHGGDAIDGLRAWLIRELRAEPRGYVVGIWRDGRRVESTVPLKLGAYTG